MSKEAYYFSHDSNARNDEKILAVRMKLGMEGYGIYWSILERMRENSDYMCVKDYNIIAFDLRVSSEKIKSLVEDYDLFQFTEDGKKFYSDSFINRMAKKDYKSEKAREAAEKRWSKNPEKQLDNADAMQTHSEHNATAMQEKERKGKEIKVKDKKESIKKKSSRFSPPKIPEVCDYMLEKKLKENVAQKESEKFWHFYDSKNWYVGKNKMKNWKSAVTGWINRMENFKGNQNGNSETNAEPRINRQSAATIQQNSQGWEIN